MQQNYVNRSECFGAEDTLPKNQRSECLGTVGTVPQVQGGAMLPVPRIQRDQNALQWF